MPKRIASPFSATARPIVEPIVQPMYDRIELATTVVPENQFFAVPRGSGGKTSRDTNMDVASQLPNPKLFLILAQCLQFSENVADTAVFTDLRALLYNGWYQLFIGTKAYLQINIFALPSNWGIGLSAATAVGGTALTFVTAHGKGPIFKNGEKSITIPPQQNFNATLSYPVTTTINVARDVWCYLLGHQAREVQ